MKISIALSTYNGAPFLQQQLDSFMLQLRLPDELVVCDDQSTDETIEILEHFKRSASFPVRIINNNSNLGHEQNFGCAIQSCSGDVVFLSDQDDVWYSDKLSVVERIFLSNPHISLVINDLDITDAKLRRTGHTVLGQTRASGTLGKNSKSFIIGCGSAFRRKLCALILPRPELEYGHDKWLHDVAQVIGGRCVLDSSLQFYRRHGNNASSWAFDGTKRASWQDMVRPTYGIDLSPSYIKHRKALSILESRMISLGSQAYEELGFLTPFHAVLSDLKNSQESLTHRIELVQSVWWKRRILAISMLLKGDYKFFLGLRSFLKDFVR